MTRAAVAGTAAPGLTPREFPRWWYLAAAALMPVGPLAVALLRLLMPYDTNDSAVLAVQKIAAHPDRESVVLWLLVLAFLTLVPGVISAVRLASRRTPVLAAVAACLLVPGYLALPGIGLIDNIGMATTSDRIDIAAVGQVADSVAALPTTTVLSVIFVAGHLIGTIMLAVALWRGRVIPTLAAVVLGISQPVHLFAAMTGNHPLDLVGWTMTAIGMAFAARALVRTYAPAAQTQ